jgi:hypothetical protein
MEHVAEALERAVVLDVDGNEHPLGETWEKETAVLLFLRHYG